MATNEERIKLVIDGLNRLDQLKNKLDAVTTSFNALERKAGLISGGQRTTRGIIRRVQRDVDAAVKGAVETSENVRQRRGARGRFLPGPNSTARRLAAEQERFLVETSDRANRARFDLDTQKINAKLQAAARKITNGILEASIKSAESAVNKKLRDFADESVAKRASTRVGRGLATINRVAPNLAATAPGSRLTAAERERANELLARTEEIRALAEPLRANVKAGKATGPQVNVLQKYAAELESLGEGFREIDRLVTLRSKGLEAARRINERFAALSQPSAAFPTGRNIKGAAQIGRGLIEAANAGQFEKFKQLETAATRYANRLERETRDANKYTAANEKLSRANVALANQREKALSEQAEFDRKFRSTIEQTGRNAERRLERINSGQVLEGLPGANPRLSQFRNTDAFERRVEKAAAARRQRIEKAEQQLADAIKLAANSASDFERALDKAAAGVSLEGLDKGGRAGGAFRNTDAFERRVQQNANRRAQQEQRDAKARRDAEISLGRQQVREEARNAAAAQRARNQRFRRIREVVGSAAIGGGFPLLFGQGGGAGIGGGVGGLLGGAFGGSGGFAGGIVGSLIGTQFDKLRASATSLAESLREPTALLDAMATVGITTSNALKNTVAALEATGRAGEAQALVYAELERLGGTDYVRNLVELETANKALQDSWSQLVVTIQAQLLPALISVIKYFTDLANAANDIGTQARARNVNPEAFAKAQADAAKEARGGLLLPGEKERLKYEQLLTEKSKQILAQSEAGKPPVTPPPVSDTQQRRALDEAIARQREAVELQRQGASLERDAADFRRDQEEAIFGFRRRAMQIEREVTEFRKGLEDKIFVKRQENQRKEAELARQVAQFGIERQDLALSDAGRIPAEQGGGRSPLVDAVREYLRTRAEGEADLQQKEINTQLEVASIQRGTAQLEADITKKVVDLREKADDYKRDTDKFAYETGKKIYDFQIKAADYQYAQWERSYKLAVDLQQKQAAALQSPLGPVEVGAVGASGAEIGRTLARALSITPEQAAGIVGNLQRESGLNPRINEGGAVGLPRGIGGYGLAQWTGSRQTDLIRFAGGPQQAGDLQTQVRFIISELLGPEAPALRQLRRAGTPEDAAVVFDKFYERSGIKALGERMGNARAAYNAIVAGGAGKPAQPNALGTPLGAVVGQPVSASAVAGPAPRVPTIAPLGTPPRLGKLPNFDAERKQLSELDQRAAQLAEQLLENERKAVELRNLAAESRLEDATAAALQSYLQPLIDANQQLEDRAAYEREYGELIQNGALPAMAEQLATQRELEKTQLRSLEIQEKAVEASIATAKARLIEKGISEEELALRERALKKLLEIRDALEGGRTAIANQSSQAEQRILDANSPDARRNRAVTGYQERINALQNTPLRAFEKLQEAKADLAELIDPLNQIMSATDALGNAFGDAFQSIISGSESADEALKKMFANIGSYFLNMAAQILAQQALTSILGLLSGGAGAAAGGGSGFQTGGLFNLKLPGFAEGGVPPVGKPSIVGENGPELFIPGVTGTIVPNKGMSATPLLPADQMMSSDTSTPEINYTGAVLNFNGNEYVSKKDVPKIIAASTAATGSKMRHSIAYRERAGI